MLTLEVILAVLAVPIFAVASIANGIAAWRNGRKKVGPLLIFLLLTAISIWNAIGYGLLAAGLFPDINPPLSVILLRPVNILTGFAFTLIPGYIFTLTEKSADADRVEEAISNSRKCKAELEQVTLKLNDRTQAIEIYETAYRTMKERLLKLQADYQALQNERDE